VGAHRSVSGVYVDDRTLKILNSRMMNSEPADVEHQSAQEVQREKAVQNKSVAKTVGPLPDPFKQIRNLDY
jgi:hypothetical protein